MTSTIEAEPQTRRIVNQRAPRWQTLLLAALAIAVVATVSILKFNALFSWRYTSDLFTTDVMLQETLRGHFALEFTYGCQFGDHACLLTLAWLPIKWLLGKDMVYFLILVSPITLLGSGAVLFAAVRSIAGSRWAVFAGLLYFLSIGVIRGPFELIFGFHIDTISGFIAVVMAALLYWNESHPSRRLTAASIAAILVLVLLKEEMALLGIIFFACLLILKRNRLYVAGLIISIAFFAGEMTLIHLSRAPWNRTNERLLAMFLLSIRRDGLSFIFSRQKLEYGLAILALLLALGICIAYVRKLNRFAIALALIGLAKLGFAFAINDFDLWSWHNYPGLVMLTGAAIFQSLELRHLDHLKFVRAFCTTLVILSAGWFVFSELPYARHQLKINRLAHQKSSPFALAMRDVKTRIPEKDRVVGIPRYSAAEWTDGWRIAFFPHGITQSPMGIADYIVITRSKQRRAVPELKVFAQIYQNRRYKLFQRKKFLPGELESRELFIKHFGVDSIGPAKPRKRK